MSKTCRSRNPDQSRLLPPSPWDWFSEGYLAYFVLDMAARLGMSAITAKYEREEQGVPSFHPRIMSPLLPYSHMQGVFGSRRIMKRSEWNAAWRVAVQEDVPDFRTMRDFRKHYSGELLKGKGRDEELEGQLARIPEKL